MHKKRTPTIIGMLILAQLSLPSPTFPHPELVKSGITNLDMIEEISKFRSSAGHDFSYDETFQHDGVYFGATDSSEPDSSMKHYYVPHEIHRGDQATIPVYVPFDGTITRVSEEVWEDDPSITNKRIEITSSEDPSYIAVLFHVNLNEDFPQSLNDWPAAVWWNHHPDDPAYLTTSVSTGDLLGYADMRGDRRNFDVAILHEVSSTEKYWVSIFNIMSNALFERYVVRNVNRTEVIFTKEYRLAHPIEESSWGGLDENDWIQLGISLPTDTDSDGVPDIFETAWGGDPNDSNDAPVSIDYFSETNLYSVEQLRDLRPGSTLLEISGTTAVLGLQLEESTDLQNWIGPIGSTTMEISVPPGEGIRFFRFFLEN